MEYTRFVPDDRRCGTGLERDSLSQNAELFVIPRRSFIAKRIRFCARMRNFLRREGWVAVCNFIVRTIPKPELLDAVHNFLLFRKQHVRR